MVGAEGALVVVQVEVGGCIYSYVLLGTHFESLSFLQYLRR